MSKEVLVFLFVEGLLLFLLTLAAFHSLRILNGWNFTSTSPKQYRFEKLAYLIVVLIIFTLCVKILLMPFFVHMADALSALLPGAMCAAGVVNANPWGQPLLFLKVLIPALAGTWLLVNHLDLQAINHPHLKAKLRFFLGIYILVALETVLDFLFLNDLNISTPVECCSALFGVVTGNGLPFGLDIRNLLILTFLFYALHVLLAIKRQAWPNLLANLALLFTGYYAVIYFFGTYIYELPTHQCPFCMMQAEYYYIGYILWGSLLAGNFTGFAPALIQGLTGRKIESIYSWNLVLNGIFILLCILPVLLYYVRNGVFLS